MTEPVGPPRTNRGFDLLGYALLGLLAGGLALGQGRIGVKDVDAFAFTCGARSIKTVGAFQWADGEKITYWPPAYAGLISLFPDPLKAAFAINYLSLWAFAAGLFQLARAGGWDRVSALGYTTALVAGMMRLYTSSAKPDILTYALFVWGLIAVRRSSVAAQLAGFLMLDAAVLLKQVAVVFTPAVLATMALRGGWRQLLRPVPIAAATGLAVAIAWLVGYNMWVGGHVYPAENFGVGKGSVASDIAKFGKSIIRLYLGTWYGTVKDGPGLVLYPLVVLLGLGCHLTLLYRKPQCAWLLTTGILVFAGTTLLRVAGNFDYNVRLLGYGIVVAVAGWPPAARTRWAWAAYGVVAVAVGWANDAVANRYGGNDPRYVEAALTAQALPLPAEPVGSNAAWVYYLHAGIITTTREDRSVGHYLEMMHPQYDAVSTCVVPADLAPDEWSLVAEVPGSRLWVRRQ